MDRKELEAKIIELVAMSYNKRTERRHKDQRRIGRSIPFDGRTCFRNRK